LLDYTNYFLYPGLWYVFKRIKMNYLNEHLNDIIQNQKLTSLFQPIVSLAKREIFAYEALIRGPSDSPLHNPLNLFSTAERFKQSLALERVCRKTSIEQYSTLKLSQKLFLNISPEVLLDAAFKKGETLAILKKMGIPASRVVIEITEHQPTDNYKVMRNAIQHYREMGFEIALDDLGAGYSGLRLWTELMPDYVKIDRHFIQDIDKDSVKLNFVRSIQSMASATNCQVIAEGIETEAEYHAVEKIGVEFCQGYYFARPAAMPVLNIVKGLFKQNQANDLTVASSIGEITQEITPISPQVSNNEVLDIFQKNSQLTLIPLVKDGVVAGLLCKDRFLTQLFSSRYGIDLHGNKAVEKFIDREPFIFDRQCAIEEVSQQLTNSLRNEQAFVITENNNYKGIGTVKDLLQLITRQQIQNAQHANPLTLLPGITPINNIINHNITNEVRFSIGYFDLDNFKPFNDIYGYDKGDQAIKLLAKLLANFIPDSSGTVGHIGGDDFIVVFNQQNFEIQCKQILSSFKQSVVALYTQEHQQAKGMHATDRKGKPCFYPLLSLSIGVVESCATFNCESHMEIADLAADAKHKAKEIVGNSYFINRRVPDDIANQEPLYSFVA